MQQTQLFNNENSGAVFTADKKQRLSLWRIWDTSKPLVMFIGLNPSTANEFTDDPTIQSVERISRFNGYGGFYMQNCWTYISTDPKFLVWQDTMSSDISLLSIRKKCKDVVFAWGNFKIVKDLKRDLDMYRMFPEALCIRQNKNGSPVHPLYQPGNSILKPFIKGQATGYGHK